MHSGTATETPLIQALALAATFTGAELAVLQTGVSQTHWGDADPALELPLVNEAVSISDASAEVAFATHKVVTQYGARSLLGVPIHAHGTLWLLSSQPNAFQQVGSLDRLVGVIGALTSPAQTGLPEWVAGLPTAAVCVMGESVSANAAACRLIGFSAREVSTVGAWFAKLYPSNSSEVRALYESDRAQGFLDPRTISIERKDGSKRLVELTCTTIGKGELWLLTDSTERVASQERFRLLFERSSTAHVIFDEAGVVDCNPAAVALLGYRSRTDLLRVRPRDLSPQLQPDGQPSGEKGVEMEAIAFASGRHRFDWEHLRADGSIVPVEVTLTPLTLGSHPVLLAEWHDITERLRAEEVLAQAPDAALSFARAKADFLATMSHEIRTPMNGVIGMTRLLLDTPLSGTQRDYVETVRACGEGLSALINDIVEFSRLDAGKVSLERLDFSVGDLVEDHLDGRRRFLGRVRLGARQAHSAPSGIVKAEIVSAPVLRFKGLTVLVAEDNVVNQRVIRGLLARLGCTVHIVDSSSAHEGDRASHPGGGLDRRSHGARPRTLPRRGDG